MYIETYFLSREGLGYKRRAHRIAEVCAPRLRIRHPRGRRMRLKADGTTDEDAKSRSGGY